jgi:hypothetical protein
VFFPEVAKNVSFSSGWSSATALQSHSFEKLFGQKGGEFLFGLLRGFRLR